MEHDPTSKFESVIPKELLEEASKDRYIGRRMSVDPEFQPIALQDGDKVVGFHLPGRTKRDKKVYTGSLFVSKEHRGKGYAAQALASFLEKHPDAISFVNQKNIPSIKAHQKAGWKDTGKRVMGNRRATVWAKTAQPYYVKQVTQDLVGDRPLGEPYLSNEAEEFLEAFRNKDIPGVEARSLSRQYADYQMPKQGSYDLTSLADKWKDQDHLRIALREHLSDARKAIGKENEAKELMDLALITQAYRRHHVPKDLQKARWAKFENTAKYPSLAKEGTIHKTAAEIADSVLEKLAVISLNKLRQVSSNALRRFGVRGSMSTPLSVAQKQVGLQSATHMAPSVLFSEGNLARALPSDEAREAIAPLMQFRNTDAGVAAIKRFYPGYEHGVTRLSRHAKKRLGETMAASVPMKEAYKDTSHMVRSMNSAFPEGDPSRMLQIRRRMKGPLVQNGILNIGPNLAVGGGKRVPGVQPTALAGSQQVRSAGGMGYISSLHPTAPAPAVSGGSTYDYLRSAGAPIGHFTPTQREVLNRFGIMHEDFERQAARNIRELPDMFRGWGKKPVPPRSKITTRAIPDSEVPPEILQEAQRQRGVQE